MGWCLGEIAKVLDQEIIIPNDFTTSIAWVRIAEYNKH